MLVRMLERRWVMLAVIFITRTAMGLMFQSLAAIGPLMIPDLELSYSQYGILLGLFMLPGGVMALPGGMLGQRYGSRHIASVGLALMVAGGLVTAESPGFAAAAFGRTASGVGGVLLNVALAKMVADWFAGREISTAMGIMLTSFPVGMALAVSVLGSIAIAHSWRTAVDLTALAAAVGLLLLIALYRDPPRPASAAAPGGLSRGRLAGSDVALSAAAGLAWGLFNAGFFVLGSFAPAYLVAGGASVASAGVIVGLGIWVSLVSVPLGGYAADRLQRPNLVIIAGCLTTALFGALMPLLPGPALWFVLMGITFGLPPGAMMALLPQAIPADRLATSLGVYYTIFYLTIAAALPLAGLARDVSGGPAAPLFFAAGATALSAACLGLFRALERRRTSVPVQV
jgi:predicted MFS family arabinose efflux permease